VQQPDGEGPHHDQLTMGKVNHAHDTKN
jgi:hypothetical protein